MAAGFLYDRLGDDRKAQSHYRPGRPARRWRSRRAQQRGGVLLPQGRQEARREALPARLRAARSTRRRQWPTRTPVAARAPTGGHEDAEQYYRKALDLQPDQPDALLQIADLIQETGGNDFQARAVPAALPVGGPGERVGAVARLPHRARRSATTRSRRNTRGGCGSSSRPPPRPASLLEAEQGE